MQSIYLYHQLICAPHLFCFCHMAISPRGAAAPNLMGELQNALSKRRLSSENLHAPYLNSPRVRRTLSKMVLMYQQAD